MLLGCLLWFPLAAAFEIEDDALRLNVLNLLAGLGAVAWIISATLLRVGLTSVFDYREFVALPIGFRTLFGLRVAAGLSGWWIPLFGPTLVYVLVARTAGLLGFAVVLAAALAMVILLGRLVAIVLQTLDSLVASWMVTLVVLGVAMAALFSLEPTIQTLLDAPEESRPGTRIAERLAESRLLASMGYVPSGLLVGILDAPQALSANLTRLAALCLAALGCLALECLLLKHHYLSLGGRPTPTCANGVHFSLAPILRGVPHLGPETCLVLMELETLMRLGWYRGVMLALMFFMPVVQTGSVYLFLVAVVWVSVASLNHRRHSFGFAHRSIGERFAMPVRLIAPSASHGIAMSVLPGAVFIATVCWSLYRLGWPDLGTLLLWLAIPFCFLVGSRGDDLYESVRSPSPSDFSAYAGKLPAERPRWSSVAFKSAILGVPALLAFLVQTTSWGSAAAAFGAAGLMIGSGVVNARMIKAADHLVRSDPHRILKSLSASTGN